MVSRKEWGLRMVVPQSPLIIALPARPHMAGEGTVRLEGWKRALVHHTLTAFQRPPRKRRKLSKPRSDRSKANAVHAPGNPQSKSRAKR
jgi:hypothetical protein